jgi:hypothetical protein
VAEREAHVSMTPKVYILATCRNPDLIRGTLMVFDTLRVGFPTAEILVTDNGNTGIASELIFENTRLVGGSYEKLHKPVIHANWVEWVLQINEPCFILDTDVVFWSNFERWNFEDVAMAGRKMPRFFDPYSKSWSQPRLHTSLCYLNPERIKADLEQHKFPADDPFKTPLADLVKAFWFVNESGQRVFYDTAALLSYHVSTRAFNEEQLDCFDHLHGGTYVDLIAPHYSQDNRLVDRYKAVWDNPALARGLWRKHDQLFAKLGEGPA